MDEAQREREAARERQSYVRHELRAPLAVMYPAISILSEGGAGPLTQEQRRYLDVLMKAAERLQARITSATESGWLDCAEVPRMIEAVSLDGLVEEHLRLRTLRGSAGPCVALAPNSPREVVAWADRSQLRAILAELVSNACAASPPDGAVQVRVASGEDAGTVSLAVSDGGLGMSPERLAAAASFGRGQVEADAAPGLGIGLWVARELVARNGGSLAIESREREGTTVTVVLPSARGAAGPDEDRPVVGR